MGAPEIILYSPHDEAIDSEKSNFEEFFKTADVKHLTFKDGKTPVAFHTRPVTYVERLRDKDRAIAYAGANSGKNVSNLTLEHSYDVFLRNCVKITGGYSLDKVTADSIESMPGHVQAMVTEIGTFIISHALQSEKSALKNS